MKISVKNIVTCFTLGIILSLGICIPSNAAGRNFAVGGYVGDVKKIDVKNKVTGVQGYTGMTFNGRTVTIVIPSVAGEEPSHLESYYTYVDSATGMLERGTIYISIYYKSDKEEDEHTTQADKLTEQYVAYLKTLDEQYPAGYRFAYLASGQRGLVLIENDYLTGRVTHKGNTLGSFQIVGTDGVPRKMLIQDIQFEMDKPYIGLYVNNDDGQQLTYQISDADKAALMENGLKGIYLNGAIMDFE